MESKKYKQIYKIRTDKCPENLSQIKQVLQSDILYGEAFTNILLVLCEERHATIIDDYQINDLKKFFLFLKENENIINFVISRYEECCDEENCKACKGGGLDMLNSKDLGTKNILNFLSDNDGFGVLVYNKKFISDEIALLSLGDTKLTGEILGYECAVEDLGKLVGNDRYIYYYIVVSAIFGSFILTNQVCENKLSLSEQVIKIRRWTKVLRKIDPDVDFVLQVKHEKPNKKEIDKFYVIDPTGGELFLPENADIETIL